MACKRYCYDGVVYVFVFDYLFKQPLCAPFLITLKTIIIIIEL